MNRLTVAVIASFLALSFSPPVAHADPNSQEPNDGRSLELSTETTHLSLVEGQLVDFKHAVARCRPNPAHPCPNLTTVRIAVTLGCLDDLALTAVPAVRADQNKITLHVTALNLVNERSKLVRCVRANTKVATVLVPSALSKVDTVELVFNRTFAPVR